MQADTAARIFFDWCASEGMLSEAPAIPTNSTAQDMGLITPKTEAGRLALRFKQVHAVASNEPQRRIIVFTRKAPPKGKKGLAAVPSMVDDVEVVYRQGASISVGAPLTAATGNPTYLMRPSPVGEVYTCGSSVSVGNHRDAGTFGCLVRNAGGQLFGLSNNHVTGSCNFAGIGLPIVAPGIWDVAPNVLAPFTIGFHAQGLTLVAGAPDNVAWADNTDAAIFRINDPLKVSSYQGDAYDTPSTHAALDDNQVVEKVGRTTRHTTGRVLGKYHGPLFIPYSMPIHNFSGPVYFEPVYTIAGNGTLFSDAGDSGSLIVTTDPNGDRVAVGIVFGSIADASAPGGKLTLALPISPILQRLNVSLVQGHNV